MRLTDRPTNPSRVTLRATALAIVLAGAGLVLRGDRAGAPATDRSIGSSGSSGERSRSVEAAGPRAPADWFYMQRADEAGEIDPALRRAALAEARALALMEPQAVAQGLGGSWTPLGPVNVGGRVTDVVADPANPNVVTVATASGGVWKSGNGGASWVSLLDGPPMTSLSIGALAMDPTDPDVVYVGTGEANPGGGSIAYPGDGVWKTTNGGNSWVPLGLLETVSIGRIAIDPSNRDRVFVAAAGNLYARGAARGLFRSTNGGATWDKVLFLSDSTGCIDVAIDPADPSRIFAAMWERSRRPSTRSFGGVTSGIWRSEDGGDTWIQLTTGLPAAASKPGRIGIAVAPTQPSRVYAIYADSTGFFAGFYASTNSGLSWQRRIDTDLATGFFYSSFGWWFGRICVDPTNAGVIWAHGIQLYRSTNGGNGWAVVGGGMHVDHHAQWIQPSDPNQIWEGNDGGLYRSTNGGASWTHIENLPITQFYTNEVHPSEPWKVYGGTQDNGTVRTPVGENNGWEEIFGGDGHYVNVDPNDPNVIYAEYQYGNLAKSTDGGFTFFSSVAGIAAGDRKNWSTPVVIDPASVGDLFTTLYYGANRLYRSTNSAASWSVVSPDLSAGVPGLNGIVFGTITTIDVARSNPATIYVGTDDGNVWVSTNAGGSWTRIDGALPNRWVTRVAVDPFDDAAAYVVFSGYRQDDPAPYVFRTTDWGTSWTALAGDLPQAPVNDIVVDHRISDVLYVGTDVGVFVSVDKGGAWHPLLEGLPDGVVVTDLDFVGGGAPTLYAATYGRSQYAYDIGVLTGVPGAGGDPGEPFAGPSGAGARLAQNAPNPFGSGTRIAFALPRAGRARIDVLNLAGERVATLLDGVVGAGPREVVWDGRDARGRDVASGVYLYRLDADGRSLTRKMIVAR